MGIYIQGIDMPKQDEILQIRIYDDGQVSRIYDIKCQQIGTAIETPNELVRCKDCKWWSGNPETMHNNHLCRNWSKFGSINTSANDYCSYGERREP